MHHHSNIRAAVCATALISLWVSSGATAGRNAAQVPKVQRAITSVYTDLSGESCKKEVDASDPNETPYLLCPGVGGYALIVRLVDSGRQSIEVVDAAQGVHPLAYQQFITRHMSTLGAKAEWRVMTKAGRPAPVALIVPVEAHEDSDHPEKLTRTYLAVAKITPKATCVTDRIPAGTLAEATLRRVADSAEERACLASQP